MSYVAQAEAVRRSRWIDRDELLSTAMALFSIGLLVLDVYGLGSRWPWFGTLFYLTCFALVVLLPSNLILSVVTLKSSLESAEARSALLLPVFNLALGLVQLWLLWRVMSLLFKTFGWLGI